jgi:predicted metal-binding protein
MGVSLFNWYIFKPQILINYFQDSVRIACTKCKRYNKSASCPPYLPTINDYKDVLCHFKNGLLLIKKYKITDISKWQELGKDSSEDIRQELTIMYAILRNQGFQVSMFGAGSCKVCEICSVPCKNIDQRLIPIEGTGLNVVGLVKKITGKQIKFPVEKQGYFYRVGIVLYNEKI